MTRSLLSTRPLWAALFAGFLGWGCTAQECIEPKGEPVTVTNDPFRACDAGQTRCVSSSDLMVTGIVFPQTCVDGHFQSAAACDLATNVCSHGQCLPIECKP